MDTCIFFKEDTPITVTGSSERHTLRFPSRRIRRVEVRHIHARHDDDRPTMQPPAVSVAFHSDGVVAVGSLHGSLSLNVVLALLGGLAPAALALGAACALRRWLATGVAIVAACGVLLLTTVTGWTPFDELLLQAAESRWIPTWAGGGSIEAAWTMAAPGGQGLLGSAAAAQSQAATNFAWIAAATVLSCLGGARR